MSYIITLFNLSAYKANTCACRNELTNAKYCRSKMGRGGIFIHLKLVMTPEMLALDKYKCHVVLQ